MFYNMHRLCCCHIYHQFILQVALAHVVIADVVDHFLRELLRIGCHVAVHEQIAPDYAETVLEYRHYGS